MKRSARSIRRRGYTAMCLALVLVTAAAKAESPAINGDPIPQAGGAQRFAVQGEFRPSLESARDSAMRSAQHRLHDWLVKQDPPIQRAPSLDVIRAEMHPREYAPQVESLNEKEKMYKMTMEFDLQPKHVRDLRERDRNAASLWLIGGLIAMLGVVVGAFRLDEWTRGYLTRYLLVGGILAIGAVVVAWWWGK